MGFFDKVKDLAEDAGKNVASTSKTLTAKADSKIKIANLKKEIEEARVKIRKVNEKVGKAFLDEYKNQIPMEDGFVIDAVNEINLNEEIIANTKIKIEEEENALEEKLSDIEREKYED
ncbi:hypothetical protein [uncultured Clostridium sp.]|uniref:hypothetical protein n=1 Tax=uncultured Clostridium sp. TaxID=59620 RepID=UPI0026098B2A|nr:hypothetical protein [uncultured Clostridium sp.]